ncbi:MAG: sigma 54-interacting transcriptional regulator [Sedimentisphaerales bacterium]|nr:sigma 54-interacting transcriptional regulator [Sedimentisphaerales bacterium]
MTSDKLTTGIPEVDRLIGGVIPGDNLVWEVDSGAPVDKFISSFLSACHDQGVPVVYVSFNRSPQTITNTYLPLMSAEQLKLIDCFSSGKGNGDEVFLDFFHSGDTALPCQAVHVVNPADPHELQKALTDIGVEEGSNARYVFDSLTGMFDLWGDEEVVLRFFGYICPRLYDLSTIAYWLLEKEAHSERFLAKLRHITQVVTEIAVSQGIRTLILKKAADRRCMDIGVPQWFRVVDDRLVIAAESREDRELGLLTRMSEALGTALDPDSFFEQTIEVLASELGMIRGTVVLLDPATDTLRIAAAHGLSAAERARGTYAVGEGVTGHVVQTGVPAVIPDITKDSRFLNRTATRRMDAAHPVAFICVPIKVDESVVGALSIDRPFAVEDALEKDLRLLSIVASIVSQVLKINRLVYVEKEEILFRNAQILKDFRRRYRLENLIGQSDSIERVLATAATAAKSRASILITGETGTGKELVANVIHYNSPVAGGPLIKVNCGALPETLLESELFGHVKGSFTGAICDRKGRFEMANGGTLFLDEIAEMSPRLQVKLLRVLQEKEFEPVGGSVVIRVDVRVVAATNKDLNREIRESRFRNDLYYRLNVIPIELPPLRERREDIPLLVNHFLEKYNRENDKKVTKLSRGVLDLLLNYPWPGNVRELENYIERAVVMSPSNVLSADLLPGEIVARKGKGTARPAPDAADDYRELRQAARQFCETTDDLAATRQELSRLIEETVIRTALAQKINQRDLAKQLGMSRTTLRKKMRLYDIHT